MPPEMWLLPSFLPVHLGLLCSCVEDFPIGINLTLPYYSIHSRFFFFCCKYIFVDYCVKMLCLKNTGKVWCYTRMIYMPMSYLYGKRFVGPITPLILQLRKELHLQPYEEINWNKARRQYAKVWLTIFY